MEDNKGKTTLEYDYGNRLVKLHKTGWHMD